MVRRGRSDVDDPFRSCIANEANDYCGIGFVERVHCGRLLDCCPIEKGPVAGVALTIILILIINFAVFNVQDAVIEENLLPAQTRGRTRNS